MNEVTETGEDVNTAMANIHPIFSVNEDFTSDEIFYLPMLS